MFLNTIQFCKCFIIIHFHKHTKVGHKLSEGKHIKLEKPKHGLIMINTSQANVSFHYLEHSISLVLIYWLSILYIFSIDMLHV